MNRKNKKVWMILGFVLISIILIAGLINFKNTGKILPFSIFSQSLVNIGADGKAYWVLTGTANNIDEGYNFKFTPSTYTKSDGTQIKPQSSLNILISKGSSYCQYQLLSARYNGCFGLGSYNYYLLGNPKRIALINIKDSNTGQTKSIDGTITDDAIFTSSNGGTLKLESQGLLSGKLDCPDYSNVAIINGKIGTASDIRQLTIAECINPINAINLLFSQNRLNTQFISAFETAPTINNNYLNGDLDLGSAVFTITASQDYFNSIVFIPPKIAYPHVSNINVPTLSSGKTSSMSVSLTNSGDTGNVLVSLESNDLSIYPNPQNIQLGSSQTLYFTVTAKSSLNDISGSVKVTACSVGQFSTSSNCDTSTKTFTIKGEGTIVNPCGNGICESNENNATCPTDCLVINPIPITGKCKSCKAFAISKLTFGLIPSKTCQPTLLALPPQTFTTCFLSFIQIIAIPVVFLFSLLFGFDFLQKFGVLRKSKLALWIVNLIISIILAYVVYITFWIGIILFAIYITVRIVTTQLKTASGFLR